MNNPILVLSDSSCCTVVPNQYQRSCLQCLDLHANKVLISLWGIQLILLIIALFCWNSNIVCCNWILLSFQFVELYPLRWVYLEYQLNSCVDIKGCVKILIYCWVHKVCFNIHIKFIPHRLSFITVGHLKLTATTHVNRNWTHFILWKLVCACCEQFNWWVLVQACSSRSPVY